MATLLTGVNDNTLPSQLKLNTFTTTTTTASTDLGFSSACYQDKSSGLSKCNTDNADTCGTSYDTCTCSSTSTTGTGCSGGNVKYTIFGAVTTTNVTPTNTTCTPGVPGCGPLRYADEWAQFLYQTDVNRAPGQQNVTMFTVDVFNAKQNADQTALLYNMACYAGGCGNYYAAKNQNQLVIDFGEIFSKIMALDSTFAAASLPISASNRTLNANEVYIGMFRPDANANPVWYGNLKRYQIANFNGDYQLADAAKQPAVNPLTGFVDDCRISYWTNNSGKYWANVSTNPSPAGLCPPANTPYDVFSDAPDGPKVEKGSVSEVLRRGNSPPATNTSPTWALNRNVYTKGFVPFDTTKRPHARNRRGFHQGA